MRSSQYCTSLIILLNGSLYENNLSICIDNLNLRLVITALIIVALSYMYVHPSFYLSVLLSVRHTLVLSQN